MCVSSALEVLGHYGRNGVVSIWDINFVLDNRGKTSTLLTPTVPV